MTPENVSRLAKIALDSENQTVSLMDLRHDWLLRQIRENGWAYAAKVSGLAVSSLRGQFGSGLRGKQARRRPRRLGGQRAKPNTSLLAHRPAGGQLHCRTGHLDVLAGGDAARRDCRADVGAGGFRPGGSPPAGREIPMGARLSRLLHEAWERQKALNERKGVR